MAVMNKTIIIFLFLLLIHIQSSKLFGQEAPTVFSGERVRVWSSDIARKSFSGTLVSLGSDTLVVRVENQMTPLLLPVNSVTKFEVLRSKNRFGIAKGAGLGFLAGAITGAIIGINTDTSGECLDSICEVNDFAALFYAAVGGGLGIVSGSFIGASLKKEHWQEIPIAKLDVVRPANTKPQEQTQVAESASQSIYLEALGSGVLYSINYERMFTKAVGGRLGVTYFTADETYFLLPLTINYLSGVSEHKFEINAGATVILDSGVIGDLRNGGAGVVGTLFCGYRYQPVKDGFLFRIGLSPIFTNNGFLPWAGLSLGASF